MCAVADAVVFWLLEAQKKVEERCRGVKVRQRGPQVWFGGIVRLSVSGRFFEARFLHVAPRLRLVGYRDCQRYKVPRLG